MVSSLWQQLRHLWSDGGLLSGMRPSIVRNGPERKEVSLNKHSAAKHAADQPQVLEEHSSSVSSCDSSAASSQSSFIRISSKKRQPDVIQIEEDELDQCCDIIVQKVRRPSTPFYASARCKGAMLSPPGPRRSSRRVPRSRHSPPCVDLVVSKPAEVGSPSSPVRDPEENVQNESRAEVAEYDVSGLCGSAVVRLFASDVATLAPEEFLNDSIIEFYLHYLLQVVPGAVDRAHVFSTFFFRRLTSAKMDKGLLKPATASASQRRHLRVRKWTKNVDIFSKHLLLFPINLRQHWFLVAVLHPGATSPSADCRPLLVAMDSLGYERNRVLMTLRDYLADEWRAKKSPQAPPLWRTATAFVPHQQNHFDCGLFLLEYAERLLRGPLPPSDSALHMESWFDVEDVATKRQNVIQLIQREAVPKVKDDNTRPTP